MSPNKLFGTYMPRSFCREYVEVKGNSTQLSMFMSVVLGIKPMMDDWISVRRAPELRKVCRQYGVHMLEDVIFEPVHKERVPDGVVGKEYITTTSSYGHPLGSRDTGEVHVFIAKDAANFRRRMWYPVIIKGRVITQPRIDSLKFGYVLGYPECCIRFFRKYNNWVKYSYLYEAFRNTAGAPSYLCNPFLKDTTFTYIYHMPCSYSCPATIRLAGTLRKEIAKREPGFTELIDHYARMPSLVFYEKKFYCFEGTLEGNAIRYRKAYFSSPDGSKNEYGEDLDEADMCSLSGRVLTLSKKGKVTKVISVPGGSEFAPEYPFMIAFP